VHGRGGVGKSTLLNALATTRPGYVVAQSGRFYHRVEASSVERTPQVVAQWDLGQDDLARPHPLTLASPNVKVFDDEPSELLRKREQQLFDRRAKEGGFAFLGLPSGRWFSRQAAVVNAPRRGAGSFDSRAHAPFDDSARPDLTRDTKQALAYAELAGALAARGPSGLAAETEEPAANTRLLSDAMRGVMNQVGEVGGFAYLGLDPLSFEPVFRNGARARTFDELPTHCRHLVAIAALAVRAAWSAYPGENPVACEAVVAIDEVELYQDMPAQAALVPALRSALPNVQWLVTTGSDLVAGSVASSEVLALRRMEDEGSVEIFTGIDALTH